MIKPRGKADLKFWLGIPYQSVAWLTCIIVYYVVLYAKTAAYRPNLDPTPDLGSLSFFAGIG